MPQVEQLKIFLASPSDVSVERRYVEDVVAEINRTVGKAMGIVLVVVSSRNAIPGHGKDGQTVINKQIARMKDYVLFVGIMWNRIGTPTARAKSGTVEEYNRAVRAFNFHGNPEIWFYFRDTSAHPVSQDLLNQRKAVSAFRKRVQRKSFSPSYKNSADFRNKFREHLTIWLHKRKKTRSNSTEKKPENKTQTSSSELLSLASTKKGTKAPLKNLARKSRVAGNTGIVKDPGTWIMLDEKYFQTKSAITQSDQSLVLRISPRNMEEAADLRAFSPDMYHNRKQIAYADNHYAGVMQVTSVLPELIAGKTSFNVTLTPIQRSQGGGYTMNMYSNNYSSNDIAELYARQILLGQPLPTELARYTTTVQFGNSFKRTSSIERGTFSELWSRLNTSATSFLPKAWLTAAYYLKMTQIVEDILELELGPVKNKVMSVRFRGRRRVQSAQEASIIKVIGNCDLNT